MVDGEYVFPINKPVVKLYVDVVLIYFEKGCGFISLRRVDLEQLWLCCFLNLKE